MILKRAAALLLAVPLLHLNIQRADVACASHEPSRDLPVAMHHAAESHAHAMVSTEPPQPAPDESCDVPAQRDCCHAVVSCSIALGLDDATSVGEAAAASAVVASATSAIPASRAAAPDPPPPKALALI